MFVFLRATCVNEYVDDVPNSFALEVTKQQALQMERLSRAVKSLGVTRISDELNGGVWSLGLLQEIIDEGAALNPYGVSSELGKDSVSVENAFIHFEKGEFFVSARPKGTDDDLMLISERAPTSLFTQSVAAYTNTGEVEHTQPY